MGLDTSHGCWHGAYGAFMRWREKLAEVAGLPPLGLMEAFYKAGEWDDPFKDMTKAYPSTAERYTRCLPIKWAALKPDVLHELLYHSDCDGELAAEICGPLADRLEQLIPLMPTKEDRRDKTQTFIDGLRAAAKAGEPVRFH